MLDARLAASETRAREGQVARQGIHDLGKVKSLDKGSTSMLLRILTDNASMLLRILADNTSMLHRILTQGFRQLST